MCHFPSLVPRYGSPSVYIIFIVHMLMLVEYLFAQCLYTVFEGGDVRTLCTSGPSFTGL